MSAATVQSTEAAVNTRAPTTKTRRRPMRSAHAPALKTTVASASVYPSITHFSEFMLASNSRAMDGSAVLTTAMSSMSIAVAAQTTASVMRWTVLNDPATSVSGALRIHGGFVCAGGFVSLGGFVCVGSVCAMASAFVSILQGRRQSAVRRLAITCRRLDVDAGGSSAWTGPANDVALRAMWPCDRCGPANDVARRSGRLRNPARGRSRSDDHR